MKLRRTHSAIAVDRDKTANGIEQRRTKHSHISCCKSTQFNFSQSEKRMFRAATQQHKLALYLCANIRNATENEHDSTVHKRNRTRYKNHIVNRWQQLQSVVCVSHHVVFVSNSNGLSLCLSVCHRRHLRLGFYLCTSLFSLYRNFVRCVLSQSIIEVTLSAHCVHTVHTHYTVHLAFIVANSLLIKHLKEC